MANPKGTFLPTTNVWDVSEIYSTDVNSEEFKELLVRLYRNINDISLAVNDKVTGTYDSQSEIITGKKLSPDPSLSSSSSSSPVERPVYLKFIDYFGELPSSADTKSVAHGIPGVSLHKFTKIYGVASDTTAKSYLPIPYASSTTEDIIELNVDQTNVNITVGKDRSAYTVYCIVLEYIT